MGTQAAVTWQATLIRHPVRRSVGRFNKSNNTFNTNLTGASPMNRILAKGALAFVGLTLTAASAVAQEINLGLDQVIASPAPASTALPWVNVRAYELDGFEPLKNTVEFQITTNQTTLDGGDPGGCCPVPGRGNLGAGEELRSISLTVNPALLAVPGAQLIVQWTGDPVVIYNDVFPDAGQKPSNIVVSGNPAATDLAASGAG